MKHSVKSLSDYTIGAIDGEIGKVNGFYFDDKTWVIRYLVVETGNWLTGRKVLISPEALIKPNNDKEVLYVNLTKEQIKNSPDIDTEKPVSRQHESELYKYYGWTNYWGGGLWAGGIGTTGMMMPVTPLAEQTGDNEENLNGKDSNADPHLRSTNEVTGYNIRAADGEIGDVEDFIINDNTWEIDFMVVDTGSWFPGKKVLISPKWIKEIKWETSTVIVNTSVENIKNSPAYDPDEPLNEAYETNLHNYYKGVNQGLFNK